MFYFLESGESIWLIPFWIDWDFNLSIFLSFSICFDIIIFFGFIFL